MRVYGRFVSKNTQRGLAVQMAVGPPHLQAGAWDKDKQDGHVGRVSFSSAI